MNIVVRRRRRSVDILQGAQAPLNSLRRGFERFCRTPSTARPDVRAEDPVNPCLAYGGRVFHGWLLPRVCRRQGYAAPPAHRPGTVANLGIRGLRRRGCASQPSRSGDLLRCHGRNRGELLLNPVEWFRAHPGVEKRGGVWNRSAGKERVKPRAPASLIARQVDRAGMFEECVPTWPSTVRKRQDLGTCCRYAKGMDVQL
jgi:hypothetical protein